MESLSNVKANARLFKYIKEFNDNLIQFNILNTISTLNGFPLRSRTIAKKYQWQLLKEVWQTIQWDNQNIEKGVYPDTVLKTKSTFEKVKGLFDILIDYPQVIKARKKNKTTLNGFSQFPDYYQRSFHFQTDGYLSEKSAKIYEQQVDILFTGLADIMRRCFIPFLTTQFNKSSSLNVLEMACGTGRGSELLKEVFPQAKITLNEISPYYLDFAKNKFKGEAKTILGPAENLAELESNSYDVSFHIFLFHEMPRNQRREVLKEQIRLTKQGGFIVICDSLQINDRPEWQEILEDFPKRYHEPFYNDYIKNDLVSVATDLGLPLVHQNKVLLTKCLIFKK